MEYGGLPLERGELYPLGLFSLTNSPPPDVQVATAATAWRTCRAEVASQNPRRTLPGVSHVGPFHFYSNNKECFFSIKFFFYIHDALSRDTVQYHPRMLESRMAS